MDERQLNLLDALSLYYSESRYAEDREMLAKNAARTVTKDTLKQTGEIFEWLRKVVYEE